jgi:hypothetical protein
VFSPDGRHIAYSSNESGHDEIYVQPFPDLDTRTQVSNEGGVEPVWSTDGKTLYFRRGRALYAAGVRTAPHVSAARPVKLLEGLIVDGPDGLPSYDVSPDGQRFVGFRSAAGQDQVEVKLILNWTEELRSLGAAQ